MFERRNINAVLLYFSYNYYDLVSRIIYSFKRQKFLQNFPLGEFEQIPTSANALTLWEFNILKGPTALHGLRTTASI